jgi:arabinogalactan endo-1,4-beta-galactosidase
VYWEPAWVSSSCWTQWGQGSHQEHATFFDFTNNVLPAGGMSWPEHDYENLVSAVEPASGQRLTVTSDSSHRHLYLATEGFPADQPMQVRLLANDGRWVVSQKMDALAGNARLNLPNLPAGVYFVAVFAGNTLWAVEKVWVKQG